MHPISTIPEPLLKPSQSIWEVLRQMESPSTAFSALYSLLPSFPDSCHQDVESFFIGDELPGFSLEGTRVE
jgi:hypothetical protein